MNVVSVRIAAVWKMRLGNSATMTAVTAPTHGPANRRPSTPANDRHAVEKMRLSSIAPAIQWSRNGECCMNQYQTAGIAG